MPRPRKRPHGRRGVATAAMVATEPERASRASTSPRRGSRKARKNAEFSVGVADDSPESSRSRPPAREAPRFPHRITSRRNSSEDSLAHIPRNESIRSLQALAQLMDNRSGSYEECRKDDAALAAIKNHKVREFYAYQNEVLDGWREVDEVLESQFPMEVMRRFATPQTREAQPAVRAPRGHESAARNAVYEDDGYATDEESDSVWAHPFSHNSQRRQHRISERALTSLSGLFQMDQGLMTRSSISLRSDGVESSPERGSIFKQQMRQSHDACNLGDLVEEGDDSKNKEPSETTKLVDDRREQVRQILQVNPAVIGTTYGGVRTADAPDADAAHSETPSPNLVWTKADRDRNDLLQNVPTHRRKQDSDAFVQMYINVNLAINFVLVGGKVLAVLSSNSVSLMASLVDSALDLLCTVVIFMTSQATAYRSWATFYKYPVGKRRLEPLGVLVFSVLMVVSFLQVLLEAVNRLWAVLEHEYAPDGGLPPVGIVFMALTIVIKSVMWLWCRHSKNSMVRAIAQDSENDVMFNLFSLFFPIVDKYLGWHILDPIGGVLLSVYIIREWIATMANTTSKLTGKVADAQDVSRCLYLVSRFSLVQAISGFELYHAGDTMVAEVDVVLPLHFQLKEAHDLGEIITYCIESLSGIERAYIHLDYNPAGQSGHIGQRG